MSCAARAVSAWRACHTPVVGGGHCRGRRRRLGAAGRRLRLGSAFGHGDPHVPPASLASIGYLDRSARSGDAGASQHYRRGLDQDSPTERSRLVRAIDLMPSHRRTGRLDCEISSEPQPSSSGKSSPGRRSSRCAGRSTACRSSLGVLVALGDVIEEIELSALNRKCGLSGSAGGELGLRGGEIGAASWRSCWRPSVWRNEVARTVDPENEEVLSLELYAGRNRRPVAPCLA